MTTQQICPGRRHTRAPGTAIICNRCRTTVVITAEGRVPEHTVRCNATVHHGMWPDRCARNAISGGYCRQHGGVTRMNSEQAERSRARYVLSDHTAGHHSVPREDCAGCRAITAPAPATRRCAAWLDCGNLAVPVAQISFRGFCPDCEAVATSATPAVFHSEWWYLGYERGRINAPRSEAEDYGGGWCSDDWRAGWDAGIEDWDGKRGFRN